MNESRATGGIASPSALRSQRGATAVVAQYIRDLSGRHAAGGSREGQPGQAPEPTGRSRPQLRIAAPIAASQPCGS
jgi:hypothetical protein